ncbi:L-2-deoxyfucosyltransferase/tylactone mycaminosyltransferase [Streptomyces zhaozhouensis]|uniref:L-2-deoxyfucosyltransferase/tylactone mycaminosyltransferase n=1 Tax=Streptomyces zhaozhouensis TaxID=1300267 RepID=A0A286E7K1_9ACTN|nr:activator-dependent family glycosyltransferase [Streptomyces zhaozhouensis]SOD66876.1 L-2-deoxyfucosyltransferase/tylactone mycaminosyltransferase [Streptomyces zhaozhouensis]
MRVLITVLALDSHFLNTVPLAWALRTAGHEVRVASQPDLTKSITNSGLTAAPVGEELNLMQRNREMEGGDQPGYGFGYNIAETDPEKLTWEYVRDTLTTYAQIAENAADQRTLEDLARLARTWQPDLVIWDAMTYSGPVVAQAVGAAQARMVFGVDHWARMRALFLKLSAQQAPEDRLDGFGDWMRGRLERLGLNPDETFSEELIVGQLTVDHFPDFLRVPGEPATRVPMRPVAHNGPSVVPGWIHEEPKRPRVLLTQGLCLPGAKNQGLPLPDMLRAAAELDVELIATVGADAGSLPGMESLPENVRLVDFVPLNEVLPSCSAIIHHGGGGTTTNALLHGTPQIIVPGWLWDEKSVAEALEEQGAGLCIEPPEFTAESLKAGLRRLLEEPGFREQAARLREELRSRPSPAAVVPQLEALAAKGGSRA